MKRDILLLHGALGTKSQFDRLIEALSDSFVVHTLNFEGHGVRVSHRDFSVKHFAQNVLEYLNNNEIKSAVVFGFSMGGYVALRLALDHPERVQKILTLGTKLDWTLESANKEVRMLNPAKIKDKVPHFAEKLMKDHSAIGWEAVLSKTASMMINLGTSTALTQKDFEGISVPVTLGRGSDDAMVSEEETLSVSQIIAQGQMVTLPETKHPIERVGLNVLVDFIKSNSVN